MAAAQRSKSAAGEGGISGGENGGGGGENASGGGGISRASLKRRRGSASLSAVTAAIRRRRRRGGGVEQMRIGYRRLAIKARAAAKASGGNTAKWRHRSGGGVAASAIREQWACGERKQAMTWRQRNVCRRISGRVAGGHRRRRRRLEENTMRNGLSA